MDRVIDGMDETQPLFAPPGLGGEVYTEEQEGGGSGEQRFECNVCLEECIEPVVTQCGHLYCWPCLYRWLNTGHSTCPMCKAGISEENVIPLFIRGSQQDPRSKKVEDVPNRPNAHRPEASPFGTRAGGLDPNTQQMSTAYGFFPSLFGLQFQNFAQSDSTSSDSNPERIAEDLFLTRVLVFIGSGVFLCLVVF